MEKSSKEVLNQLIKHKQVSVDDLSRTLNKTSRTIYNYIKRANDEAVSFGVQIISNYDGSYCLLVLDDTKYKDLMDAIDYSIDLNNPQDRINHMISVIFMSKGFIKIDDLAEKMNISRSQAKKDISKIRGILEKYDLTLKSKPHHGLYVDGNEYNMRKCYSHHNGKDNFESYIDKSRKRKIKDKIRDIVVTCLLNSNFKMSDDSLDNLVMHIYIAYQRISADTYISFTAEIQEEQKKFKEYQIACDIALMMNEIFGIELDQSERGYITIHLRSKKSNEKEGDIPVSNDLASKLSQLIIAELTRRSMYDFSKDLDFTIALYQHLIILLVRAQYSNYLENPLLNEIKSKMNHAYDLAVQASRIVSEHVGVDISEGEIGFIAMHIETALERRKSATKKKIIVVCSSGKGTAKLLKLKYERLFSDCLSEIVVCSKLELDDLLDDKIDCIFTTINLEINSQIPVIRVNSLLDDEEIESSKKRMVKHRSRNAISKCLKEELLLTGCEYGNKETALGNMVMAAQAHYAIPEGFLASVLQREEASSTEFDSIIAIPHPIYPMTEETFIVIAILDKPIVWDKQTVKIIVLLSCSKNDDSMNDIDELYAAIESLLNSRARLNALIKNPTYHNLLELVGNHDA